MSSLIPLPDPKPSTPSVGKQSAAFFKRASFAAVNNKSMIKEEMSIGDSVSRMSAKSNKSMTSSTDVCCNCQKKSSKKDSKMTLDPKLLEQKLLEREEQLREEFNQTLEKETTYLKERFDFILQNEQARASCMLREAHRERKEKIAALQQQLECKNMAGLMYVMCAERTKCKVEKLQLIETYTNYINMLNEILVDGQELILNLSRGYKTAARVDYEWQEKMKKVVGEFQAFIYHFSGTPPDQNQYLLDLPKILHTEAPKEDDPNENPIEEEEPEPVDPSDLEANKEWWELLDEDSRPFAVFGDMAPLMPIDRRAALKKIKATKTAPKRWREYVFHDMLLQSSCPNVEDMKNEYFNRIPDQMPWDCHTGSATWDSKLGSRRQTTQSMDLRGNMGSILKIITTTGVAEPVTKANLLGARDSMEIASSTRVRDKTKSMDSSATVNTTSKVAMKLSLRRTSFFNENLRLEELDECIEPGSKELIERSRKEEDDTISTAEGLSKEHTDSLEVISRHIPERDHVINYEKKCPMEACKRKHVDSFMHALPKYMRASPFTHFEETFEQYETCSPEQLMLLKQRIDEKKKKERIGESFVEFDPLLEWKDSVIGVGVQTSDLSYLDVNLPPCTCRDSVHTLDSAGAVYRLEDLIPVKQNLNQITKECLYDDDQIQFHRFKVVGQDSDERVEAIKQLSQIKKDFTRDRLREIQKILKQHPSLLDIFQANAHSC